MITLKDIPATYYGGFDVKLPNGWTAKVQVEGDQDMRGFPWKEEDGHGEVREVRYSAYDGRTDKHAGEREMYRDQGRAWLYDFAGAMEIAKRDGWGCGYPANGHAHLTKGQIVACAVEQDFKRMSGYLRGDWGWIGIVVTLEDAEGIDGDIVESLWGIESDGDDWREIVVELINQAAGGIVMESDAATAQKN